MQLTVNEQNDMKTKLNNLITVMVLGLSLVGVSVYADNDKDKENNGNHNGQVIKAEKDTPTLPSVAERENISPEVKKAIAKFDIDREKYLEGIKQLQKQLIGTTGQERDKIREQIKESRDRWIQQNKEAAKEITERMKEINKPNRQEILDSVKDQGHPRRGN